MALEPDPDDPRRPLPPGYYDTGRWSIVPIVVAALAFFVAAFFVFADLTPDDSTTNTEGTSIQPKTPAPHPQ
jgi:hypothetical protein